jgi:putative adenylate-forming enzyme
MMLSEKRIALQHYFLVRYWRRWKDRPALEQWQEARIQQHLSKVQKASPFYRELWDGLPLSQWKNFPIIDKQLMMNHFDQLNTMGIRKEDAFGLAMKAEQTRDFTPKLKGVTVGLSSGTSGSRGIFLVSSQEQYSWAGMVLAKVLPGSLLAAHRIAFFLRANSNLYGSVSGGRLRFEFFDLLEPMHKHIQRLNHYCPNLWIAPPSVLRLLADAYRQGNLLTKPKRIVSVAEVLDPQDCRYIESILGLPIHQVYQCTEGFLAATCPRGTLHLNEDIVAFQKEAIADVPNSYSHSLNHNLYHSNSRRFVPIITDFTRFTQPIVRYRLNDMLIERTTPCPCGSIMTAIEAIEGRCDDLFYLPHRAAAELVPVFPDLITRAVMGAAPFAAAYRIIQTALNRIELSIQLEIKQNELNGLTDLVSQTDQASVVTEPIFRSPNNSVHYSTREALESLFQRMDCIIPEIVITPYESIPDIKKLRRVERRFSIE